MAKKKLNKKAKTRIFLFFIIFGSIIGSLSYSFFSNVSKIIEIKNEDFKWKISYFERWRR